ncbi:hypothetical protein R3P38DRAFT_3214379 [Favolaschia claudopus]|uniref:F-box domain-containing protein n=1 Tax=Favolaschia claudopus TaxID=2862362 RepID=A0AAW0AAU2_9AGAR
MSSNPLRIQELLDLCITFLSESPADLLSCSLVARSWVNAAQSELFRTPHLISVRSDRAARKFCNALSKSPHLGHHVRELSMGNWPALIQNLDPVTFTHLHTLRFYIGNVSVASELYRPLLSLSTLRTLHLDTSSRFLASVQFLVLCPTIRHLNLSCREDYEEPQADFASSLSEKLPFIRLTSLELEISGGEDPVQHNLNQAALYPLDISELKVLSIWGSSTIRWNSLPPAAQESIRIVDSNFWLGELDLSPFKNLAVLRLGMIQGGGGIAESDVRCTLASISPANPIQIVVLGLSNGLLRYNKEECTQIDRILISLAERDVRVELEFHLDTQGAEEKVRDWFPTIAAEKKFHLVYRSYGMTDVWLRPLHHQSLLLSGFHLHHTFLGATASPQRWTPGKPYDNQALLRLDAGPGFTSSTPTSTSTSYHQRRLHTILRENAICDHSRTADRRALADALSVMFEFFADKTRLNWETLNFNANMLYLSMDARSSLSAFALDPVRSCILGSGKSTSCSFILLNARAEPNRLDVSSASAKADARQFLQWRQSFALRTRREYSMLLSSVWSRDISVFLGCTIPRAVTAPPASILGGVRLDETFPCRCSLPRAAPLPPRVDLRDDLDLHLRLYLRPPGPPLFSASAALVSAPFHLTSVLSALFPHLLPRLRIPPSPPPAPARLVSGLQTRHPTALRFPAREDGMGGV